MPRCSGRLEAARCPTQIGRHGCRPPPRCCCDGGATSAGDHSWAAAVVVDLCRVHHQGVDLHLAVTISPIPCRTKVRRSYAVRTLASPLLPVRISWLPKQEHRTPEILICFQHLVHTCGGMASGKTWVAPSKVTQSIRSRRARHWSSYTVSYYIISNRILSL